MSKKICIVGAVNSGKSTFVGHYLYTLGVFDDNALREAENASEKTKSWKWAYLVDICNEERENGITTDYFNIDFKLNEKTNITFVDTPGHTSLINRMIEGSTNANCAIFIVSMKENEIKNSLNDIEHLHILKCLGINNVLVLLNKSDLVQDKTRVDHIQGNIRKTLSRMQFKNIRFIEISALNGVGFELVTSYLKELPIVLNVNTKEIESNTFKVKGVTLTSQLITKGFTCVAHILDKNYDVEVVGIEDEKKNIVFTKKGKVYTIAISLPFTLKLKVNSPVILRNTSTLFISRIV